MEIFRSLYSAIAEEMGVTLRRTAFSPNIKERRDLIPAASSGSMNNVAPGGVHPVDGAIFSYYETVGRGMGASSRGDGSSGIHTHLTNSLNTPVEALEYVFPLRVRRYSLRRNTGGAGSRRGGDGTVREVELLADAEATVLSERRRFAPYGLAGGLPGKTGRTTLAGPGGRRRLPSKCRFRVRAGERVIMETPGGGGWGPVQRRKRR